MSTAATVSKAPRRHGRMVAMVLGTALSTFAAPAIAPAADTVNDLSRYCTACWRNARLPADCWTDCTQDVLTRLLERVPTQEWERTLKAEGDERREFLRAIDAVKKRVQRGKKWAPYPADSIADQRSVVERQRAETSEELRLAADELLNVRQKSILQLTAEGWSVQEIADRLATGAERVSDEKYKAIRKLRTHLHERMLDA